MRDQFLFIAKVFLFSTLISILIKSSGGLFQIPPTDLNALLIVLTPFVLMTILLTSRTRSSSEEVGKGG